MKYRYLFAMAVLACMTLAGCENDNLSGIPEGAMELNTEGMGGGTKTSVSAETVQWVSGDVVSINGTDYTVSISDGKAYTSSAVTEADAYYAYYNCGTVTNPQTTSPTVTVPSRYPSSYSGGRQVIALPMAAYSASNTKTVTFRHLTAALQVTVTNSTGFDGLYIDSVQVVSASQNLHGAVALDLTAANYSLAASDGSNRTVTVYFARESVQVDNSSSLTVQVPILPIASKADDLTVKVYSHNKANIMFGAGIAPANVDFTFSRTKAAPALGRNVMSRAAVSVTNGTDYTTIVDHSLFAVSGSKNVRFSQGNLQATYDGSAWTWAFASNQYGCIGNAAANTSITGNGTIAGTGTVDLFGWSTTANFYGIHKSDACDPFNPTPYSGTFVDWGANAINNGGNVANMWNTLTKTEWQYLFNSTSKYGCATVCGVTGIILLPKYFTDPKTNGGSGAFVNGSSMIYTNNVYTSGANWDAMEAAGAVFLPAAGWRNVTTVKYANTAVNYWSATAYEQQNEIYAYSVYFIDRINSGVFQLRYEGRSVRLVKNAN